VEEGSTYYLDRVVIVVGVDHRDISRCVRTTHFPHVTSLWEDVGEVAPKWRRAGSQIVGSPVLLVVGPYLATVTSQARGAIAQPCSLSLLIPGNHKSNERARNVWGTAASHCVAIGHTSPMLGPRPQAAPEASTQESPPRLIGLPRPEIMGEPLRWQSL
jgi:hypothetical protein